MLLTDGQWGVYELDYMNRLRAGHASPLVAAKAGKALDLGWLPLPWWVAPASQPAWPVHHNKCGFICTVLGFVFRMSLSRSLNFRFIWHFVIVAMCQSK